MEPPAPRRFQWLLTVYFTGSFLFPPPLHSRLMQIFLSGSKPAPDMAFGFVHIQHFSCLFCECRINLHQPVCNIFMHGRYYLERLAFLIQRHLYQQYSCPPPAQFPLTPNRQTNARKSLHSLPCPPQSFE